MTDEKDKRQMQQVMEHKVYQGRKIPLITVPTGTYRGIMLRRDQYDTGTPRLTGSETPGEIILSEIGTKEQP